MDNTRIGIIVSAGVVAGLALVYGGKLRRKRSSLLGRTLERANHLLDGATKLCSVASVFLDNGKDEAERQKRGFAEALHAGRRAYQRVAG